MLGAGVRVVALDPARRMAVAELPLRPWNRNPSGSHFGGAIATMCDPFFAYLIGKVAGDDCEVSDRTTELEFRLRSRRRLRATFSLDETAVASLLADLDRRGAALVPCQAEVRDTTGSVVAVVTKTVHVRRRGRGSTRHEAAGRTVSSVNASAVTSAVGRRRGAGRRGRSLSAFTSDPVAVVTLVRAFCGRSLRPVGERRVAWAVSTDRGVVRCHAVVDGDGWRVVSGPCSTRHVGVSVSFPDLLRLASGELTVVRGVVQRSLHVDGWIPWVPWMLRAGLREQIKALRARREWKR